MKYFKYILQALSQFPRLMQFVRYCISGFMTAVVFFSLIYFFVNCFALPVHLSIILSALVSYPANFFLHKIFSFRSTRCTSHSAMRYIVAAICTFTINGILLQTLLEMKIHYLIAQLILTPLLLISNYFILWIWVFSEKATSAKEEM